MPIENTGTKTKPAPPLKAKRYYGAFQRDEHLESLLKLFNEKPEEFYKLPMDIWLEVGFYRNQKRDAEGR